MFLCSDQLKVFSLLYLSFQNLPHTPDGKLISFSEKTKKLTLKGSQAAKQKSQWPPSLSLYGSGL